MSLSDLQKENTKVRIDASYFSKSALAAAQIVEARSNENLGILASVFRKGIFDIKADTYAEYGDGVPFVRIGDLKNGLINRDTTEWISFAAHQAEAKTQLIYGDIILSKTAYPAASFVNLNECNVSQDTIAVQLSEKWKNQFESAYVVAFLNSRFGMPLMEREFQGNVQQHLSLDDGKKLKIPYIDTRLQSHIDELFRQADTIQDTARLRLQEAEFSLRSAIGLHDWTPENPLTYSARSSNVFTSGRLDAQYYRPKYQEVQSILDMTRRALALDKALVLNTRGTQPDYSEQGLPVINSKHVRTNRVVLNDDNRRATEGGASIIIQPGDVLLNGTGVGTIGRAAPYLYSTPAIPDNHVTVLRPDAIDPIYLSAFLNSPLGQLQIERYIKGSSGQIELYPTDIAKIVVWDAPDPVQQQIRGAVLGAFDQERKAIDLLEYAKRAVEIAIEESESAALAYLSEKEDL